MEGVKVRSNISPASPAVSIRVKVISFWFIAIPGMSTWEHHMKQCFNKQESVQYPCNSDNSEMCEWFSLKQNLNVSMKCDL